MTEFRVKRASSFSYKLATAMLVIAALAVQPVYGLLVSQDVLADAIVTDTVKPEVSLVSPASPNFDSTDTDIVVKATDDHGLNKVVANLYKNNVLYKSTQASAGGVIEFTHTIDLAAIQGVGLLPVGDYSVKYNAIDQAGNISSTKTYAFTIVDKVKPVVTLISPVDHGPVAESKMAIQVDATDDRGLDRIVANIYKDGFLYKSTQSALGGAKSGSHKKTIDLPDGEYTIRYNASDTAGNIAATGNFAYSIDTTSPATPALETPEDGSTLTANNFWFDWSDSAEAASYEVQFSQSDSVDTDGSLNVDVWSGDANHNQPTESRAWSAGATGTWYWQVRAVDAAGNKSSWSIPWKLTITPDNTSTEEPPVVVPTEPVDPGDNDTPTTAGSGSTTTGGVGNSSNGTARTIEPQQLIAIAGLQPSTRAAAQFTQLNPSRSDAAIAVEDTSTSTANTPLLLGANDSPSENETSEVKGAATESGWLTVFSVFWWVLPAIAVPGLFWWLMIRRRQKQVDQA